MSDIAHKQTDKIIEDIEKRLSKEYKQAYNEISKKASDYFAQFEKADKEQLKLVKSGVLSKKEYNKWRQNQMLTGQRWIDLRDNLATDMTNVNKVAASIINGELANVLVINGNYASYLVENSMRTNYGFTLYSKETVNNLIANDPDIIPWKPKVDTAKDILWNRQQITSHVTQGILQGESIPKLAKRLSNTVGNNRASAVRTARTAITSCENAGRQMVYERAADMGIQLKKQWMATLDDRTRDDHADADGQTVDINEKFEVGGEEMEYPGDMSASPGNVYNCRCTTITVEPPSILQGEEPRMTYREWVNSK